MNDPLPDSDEEESSSDWEEEDRVDIRSPDTSEEIEESSYEPSDVGIPEILGILQQIPKAAFTNVFNTLVQLRNTVDGALPMPKVDKSTKPKLKKREADLTLIRDTLSVDSLCRKVGITGDLFMLDAMKLPHGANTFPFKRWNHSLPHTHYNNWRTPTYTNTRTKYVAKHLYKHYAYLQEMFNNVDISDNVIVAGGALFNSIINFTSRYGDHYNLTDVDIFIHVPLDYANGDLNKRKERADFIVKTIINGLCNFYGKDVECDDEDADDSECSNCGEKHLSHVRVVKNDYTITINCLDPNEPEGGYYHRRKRYLKYQIILRLYSHPSEVLHGFDVGCAAIGFDGVNVFTTTLGKFALEYGYNILDTTRRSTSYEYRLQKYRARGIGIIFPGMENGKEVKFGKAYIRPSRRGTNHGTCFYKSYLYNYSGVKPVSDYSTHGDGDVRNIRCLIYGKKDYITIGARNAAVKDISTWSFFSSGYTVADVYAEHFNPFERRPRRRWYWYRWRGSKLVEYLLHYTKEELTKITNTYIENAELANPDIEFPVYIGNVDKVEEVIREIAKDKHSEEIAEIEERMREIRWITDNPGRQDRLTSSINPIFEDPRGWYGEAYAPFSLFLPINVLDYLWWTHKRRYAHWCMLPKNVMKIIISWCAFVPGGGEMPEDLWPPYIAPTDEEKGAVELIEDGDGKGKEEDDDEEMSEDQSD